MPLFIPEDYTAKLAPETMEQAITYLKEIFPDMLARRLRLRRVTAPLFVLSGTGINDDLNGVERAVSFPIRDLGDRRAEVVHSLAKWKRMKLGTYKIAPGYGLYTDMNAIRADEELKAESKLRARQARAARKGKVIPVDSTALREIDSLIARNDREMDSLLLQMADSLAADSLAFPYACPAGYLEQDWHEGKNGPDGTDSSDFRADYPVAVGCERLFMAAQFRRAGIVIVAILAVCLGL